MPIKKVKKLDFQYAGDRTDRDRLRRFNDELRDFGRAVNQIIDTLEVAETNGGTFTHEFASTAGLGASHQVANLSPGMVLVAFAEDDAKFDFLALDDLSDVDVDGAQDGDVLQRSGNQWVPATLPGVSSLNDPGDNLIVYWNEDDDDLDFLQLGTGLLIAGGMLVLDSSALDHGNLAGLSDNDHPQYPLSASSETISGDWTFTGAILFERSMIDITLRESVAGIGETDWLLTITGAVLDLATDDGFGSGQSILRASRTSTDVDSIALGAITLTGADGIFSAIDYGAQGEAALHSFFGDLQILDDGAIYLGDGGEISMRFDETDSFITTTGDVYWDNTAADETGATLFLGFDEIEQQAPATQMVWRSLEAEEDEGGWGLLTAYGMMQIAAMNDDGSVGEAWVTVHSDGGQIADSSIDFSGGALRFNGKEVLAADTSGYAVIDGSTGDEIITSIDQALLRTRSTGVQFGGRITGQGTATATIAAGRGGVLDTSDPANPAFMAVTWSETSFASLANGTHYYYVDQAGDVQTTDTEPSHVEFRSTIVLGRVSVTGGVISGIASTLAPLQQFAAQINDLFRAIGQIKRDMVVQPSGANLKVAITAGEFYEAGANFHNEPRNPHEVEFDAFDSNVSDVFRMVTQTGVIASNVTDLPVGSYDVSGTVTAIPGAASRATIFTVFRFQSGNVRILYGQEFYNTLSAAITALATYNPILPANFSTTAIILGYIIATKGATALDDSASAYFVTTNRFGGKEGGVAVAGSLPATSITYDNATSGLTATNVQDAIDELAALIGP